MSGLGDDRTKFGSPGWPFLGKVGWTPLAIARRSRGAAAAYPAGIRPQAIPQTWQAQADPRPGSLLALGSLRVTDQRFAACLLVFIAVIWGSFSSGAFYQAGLAVLVMLALAAAGVATAFQQVRRPIRWWLLSALPPIVAIVLSAVARHQLWALWYALAPVVAAASLGVAGSAAGRLSDRLLFLRLVMDAALLVAALCWLGVAWHVSAFAQPLSDGWRASGPIGYPNVTGLLLLLGLLCACAIAARSQQAVDQIRCCVLATAALATQSRSVVVAAVICAIVLWRAAPGPGRILIRSGCWGLLAFAGLLPSIHSERDGGLLATLALAGALVLTQRTASGTARPGPQLRLLMVLLGGTAVGLALVSLHQRIFDAGSNSGHLQLWLNAMREFRWSGPFGFGPSQVAELSRGQLVTVLVHSDPLQYAQYYGLPGVAAMIFISLRLASLLVRRRSEVPADMWAIGLCAAAAVTCVMLVDFPLQVPLIPAISCLIVGATIGTPEIIVTRKAHECQQ